MENFSSSSFTSHLYQHQSKLLGDIYVNLLFFFFPDKYCYSCSLLTFHFVYDHGMQTDGRKKDSSVKLLQLSAGGSSELNNHLDFVNKLRDHWYQGRNAVVFDDQVSLIHRVVWTCVI